VLISTHHITELESFADHVGVLRDGRLVAQMAREELQRMVRSYQLEVPGGWQPPPEMLMSGLRRSNVGRVVQCTLVGDERHVMGHLTATGVVVRQVSTLSLEDSALAFLPEDPT
jgi:ABC-type multidrug transport system ATPase subunit